MGKIKFTEIDEGLGWCPGICFLEEENGTAEKKIKVA